MERIRHAALRERGVKKERRKRKEGRKREGRKKGNKDDKDKKDKDKKDKKKEDDKDSKKEKETKIDFDGIEERIVMLPIEAGNYYSLESVEGKLLYMRRKDDDVSLKYYDLKEREEKNIISGISGYMLAANGKNILVVKGKQAAVITPAENQEMDMECSTAITN